MRAEDRAQAGALLNRATDEVSRDRQWNPFCVLLLSVHDDVPYGLLLDVLDIARTRTSPLALSER